MIYLHLIMKINKQIQKLVLQIQKKIKIKQHLFMMKKLMVIIN